MRCTFHPDTLGENNGNAKYNNTERPKTKPGLQKNN